MQSSGKRSFYGGLALLLLLLAAGWAAIAAMSRRVEADMSFGSGPALRGPFEEYWKANGGLARFGTPLTGVYETTDGYAAQYFERAALIYDPGALPDYSVQPQALGWVMAASRCTEAQFSRVSGPAAQGRYFAATGHTLSGKFLDYWTANGGAASFGYPISEPFTDHVADIGLLVQYFERARFELHTGQVLLGLLGTEALQARRGAELLSGRAVPTFYPNTTQPPSSGAQGGHRLGHAPDYAWVAGRVRGLTTPGRPGPLSDRPTFPPQVVAGSTLDPKIPPEPTPTRLPNGVTVGTAEHFDVSPPLRDITPRPVEPRCSPYAGDIYMPAGPRWDPSRVKDGDYVVLFGHLAAPGEAQGAGDQGRPYVVDRMEVAP